MDLADQDLTLAEIDEALGYMREKVQDRYGNRLNWHQKEIYWESINDLLEARLSLTEGNHESKNLSDYRTLT
jgi:hypothetical protein